MSDVRKRGYKEEKDKEEEEEEETLWEPETEQEIRSLNSCLRSLL